MKNINNNFRSVSAILNSHKKEVGGFSVRSPLPNVELNQLSPFLLLDHLGPFEIRKGHKGGVSDHPHRGFETVTFVFDGYVEHKDSYGNHGVLGPGDVQWMTAGAGVVHSEQHPEEFVNKGGKMHGIQLWVNLPKKDKMIKPNYQDIPSASIPVIKEGTTNLRVVAGEYQGVKGAASVHTPMLVLNGVMKKGDKINIQIPSAFNAALYIIEGKALINENSLAQESELTVFDNDGYDVQIESKEDVNFLLISGEPINEKIVSYGPFVMNTQREILEAFEDYQSGKMGRIDFQNKTKDVRQKT